MIKIHWKFAVKIDSRWVSLNEETNNYYLSSYRKNADTRWDVRGAKGIYERYVQQTWNRQLGEKPVMDIVKIHRPQKLNLGW